MIDFFSDVIKYAKIITESLNFFVIILNSDYSWINIYWYIACLQYGKYMID